MAIVHRAELKPSKLELLASWLPQQEWYVEGEPAEVDRVATFRLDDPAGDVGIETFIVTNGIDLFHVPLTYRGAPLAGGVLVGELEHSVLGRRWVYDGPSDPVYVAVTTAAIVSGGHEVEMEFPDGTVLPRMDWAAAVVGSGATSEQGAGALTVARRLPADSPVDAAVLTASWAGQVAPLVVAWLGN